MASCRVCGRYARVHHCPRHSGAVSRKAKPIPSARLAPLIDVFERENAGSVHLTQTSLARRLYKVRHEEDFISFEVADRLLVDMDLVHEWHGELADLYEAA